MPIMEKIAHFAGLFSPLRYPPYCFVFPLLNTTDLGGKLISKFGREGNKDGEFNGAHYLSINKEGFLTVCNTFNHRIQVFELSGKFVTKFGCEGSERGEFKHPNSTANLSDGKIVVFDKENNRFPFCF